VVTEDIAIHHDDGKFVLSGPGVDYRFHVDATGDLVHDYYGAPIGQYTPVTDQGGRGWGIEIAEKKREFPDSGRGDFRLPAIHLRHSTGSTVTHFKYTGYEIISGKPSLDGLPATFGTSSQVSTLIIRLSDPITSVDAELYYSIFPQHKAIVRSFKITNRNSEAIEVQRAASMSVDFPGEEWEFLRLCGDWGREMQMERTPVHRGVQG
jgi:alpha-galactosidase